MSRATYGKAYISTIATTQVFSGTGVLGRVTVNKAAGAGGTATLYDDTATTAGSIFAIIDTTVIGTKIYDCGFTTGLRIVTAVAAADITVSFG